MPFSKSCRAGLVALFKFLQGVFFLGVCCALSLPLFLELRFALSFVLKPAKKLDGALPTTNFLSFERQGLRCGGGGPFPAFGPCCSS